MLMMILVGRTFHARCQDGNGAAFIEDVAAMDAGVDAGEKFCWKFQRGLQV